jgi:hypothetical protein
VTFCPGGIRSGKRGILPGDWHRPGAYDGGSVFLDSLLAILFGVAALLAAIGGISSGVRIAAETQSRAAAIVVERNERAVSRPVELAPSEAGP